MRTSTSRGGRAYRGVSEQERQRERRARLVEAGLQVFGDIGYHAATVKSLCNAAGLTERYFYESFSNREELFQVVYRQCIDHLRSRIVETIASQKTPEAMAKKGLTAYFEALRGDARLSRIVLTEATRVGGAMDAEWRATVDSFAMVLKEFSPLFLSKAAAKKVDLELLAAGLVGVALNVSMTWYHSGFEKPLEAVVGHCYLYFDAIRTYGNEKRR